MRTFLKHVRVEHRFCKDCKKDILHQVGWFKDDNSFVEQYECLKCHKESERILKEKEVYTSAELERVKVDKPKK